MEKEIKLTEGNESKITAVIDEVQSKSRVRTISIVDIKLALEHIENETRVTKKALEGTTVLVDENAQHFPNTYKGKPQSTHFTARYSKGNWYITDIFRGDTFTNARRFRVNLSDTAKQAVLDRMSIF